MCQDYGSYIFPQIMAKNKNKNFIPQIAQILDRNVFSGSASWTQNQSSNKFWIFPKSERMLKLAIFMHLCNQNVQVPAPVSKTNQNKRPAQF